MHSFENTKDSSSSSSRPGAGSHRLNLEIKSVARFLALGSCSVVELVFWKKFQSPDKPFLDVLLLKCTLQSLMIPDWQHYYVYNKYILNVLAQILRAALLFHQPCPFLGDVHRTASKICLLKCSITLFDTEVPDHNSWRVSFDYKRLVKFWKQSTSGAANFSIRLLNS